MAPLTYAICFDLPGQDDPLFAWSDPDGRFGFTVSLADATRFPSHDLAERTLEDWYPTRDYGVVVETEWTCPSCGTVWPEREDGDDVTGCGECGRFIAEDVDC